MTAALTPRERAWREIRRFGDARFTLRDLHGRLPTANLDTLRRTVHGLAADGHLRQVGEVDVGSVAAAKVYVCANAKADVRPRPRVKDSLQQDLWTAMRSLRAWTVTDLAIRASREERPVSDETASVYVSTLVKAGIVQVLQGRTSAIGAGSAAASYRLAPSANSGPAAPEVRRGRRVFDPNRRSYVDRTDAAQVPA